MPAVPSAMRALRAVALVGAMEAAVAAHPHPGGIAITRDGSIWLGDVARSRLTVVRPDGAVAHRADLGHVRELAVDAADRIWGASQSDGLGLWRLDGDRRVVVDGGFHGLFALDDAGGVVRAPADSRDHRPTLVLPDGSRRSFDQIDAVTWAGDGLVVADHGAIYRLAPGGARVVATGIDGVLGIAARGGTLFVAARRLVVRLDPDGGPRVVLASEPPWIATDVAVAAGGALYVLEHAEDCCAGGPRVRRIDAGGPPRIVYAATGTTCGLSIDALRCVPPARAPAPAAPASCGWRYAIAGAAGVAALAAIALLARARRRRR